MVKFEYSDTHIKVYNPDLVWMNIPNAHSHYEMILKDAARSINAQVEMYGHSSWRVTYDSNIPNSAMLFRLALEDGGK